MSNKQDVNRTEPLTPVLDQLVKGGVIKEVRYDVVGPRPAFPSRNSSKSLNQPNSDFFEASPSEFVVGEYPPITADDLKGGR